MALRQISEAQKELQKVIGEIGPSDPAPAPIRTKDLVALVGQHALNQSRVAFPCAIDDGVDHRCGSTPADQVSQ